MRAIWLFALSFFLSAVALSAPQQMRTESPAPPVITASAAEVAVLKAQLETTKSFQDQMMATVWSALAALVTVAVLLVGYSWFTNQRNYDRDLKALRTEVVALGKELQAELHERLVQVQNDSQGKLDAAIEEKVKPVRNANETAVKKLSARVHWIEMHMAETARSESLKDKNYGLALLHDTTYINTALAQGNEYFISQGLGYVSSDLAHLEQASGASTLNASIAQGVASALDQCKNHQGLAVGLKERLSRVRISG